MSRNEWMVWAERCLTETRHEMAHGRAHPGPGYAAALKAQEARLVRDIGRAKAKASEAA